MSPVKRSIKRRICTTHDKKRAVWLSFFIGLCTDTNKQPELLRAVFVTGCDIFGVLFKRILSGIEDMMQEVECISNGDVAVSVKVSRLVEGVVVLIEDVVEDVERVGNGNLTVVIEVTGQVVIFFKWDKLVAVFIGISLGK